MSEAEERKRRDEQVSEIIMSRLIASGEKDRLKEYLRSQLSEAGFENSLRQFTRELILKKGTEKISVDELTNEIIPLGRAAVPPQLKQDVLKRTRDFLQSS